jgi:hypothetical protein
VREQVTVKLLNHDGELYVLACSAGRQDKERAMRRRLKRLGNGSMRCNAKRSAATSCY